MVPHFNRRMFLGRLAASAAGAALLPFAWQPAAALTLDENSARERVYLAACESRTAHERLIDEMVAQLDAADPQITPETRARNVERVKATSCPVCGCQLGAIQPYPTRF